MTDACTQRPSKKDRPKRKPPSQNPIEAAVLAWLDTLPDNLLGTAAAAGEEQSSDQTQTYRAALVAQAPKRWTIYEPMVLLPTGSFSSPAWTQLLTRLSRQQQQDLEDNLWRLILAEISRKNGGAKSTPLTHLAVNEGIPLDRDDAQEAHGSNILRSPTGLVMLHGDFGPDVDAASTGNDNGTGHGGDGVTVQAVDDADFARAFWVSTKQNGIYQTWAPRWTMFSRGNIKEKARLLDFYKHNNNNTAAERKAHTAAAASSELRERCYAVDMYAGIGYFVFCYARLGLRVLCWEINPWSVEGLRRGAEGNGWTVRVIKGEEELSRPTTELVSPPSPPSTPSSEMKGQDGHGDAQIVVFLEDNKHAARRIAELREAWSTLGRTGGDNNDDKSRSNNGNAKPLEWKEDADEKPRNLLEILHVNCGLLPTSTGAWAGAWDMTRTTTTSNDGAWLHLHENVGVADIETRKLEIEQWFTNYEEEQQRQHRHAEGQEESSLPGPRRRRAARVDHVELVKTFAPGVWHCVFDVHVTIT